MKFTQTGLVLVLILAATTSVAKSAPDKARIKQILQHESAAWNKGDAEGFGRNFAKDGTFTNVLGMFFQGHEAFVARHSELLHGVFRGTVLQQEVVSLKFASQTVAVMETLTSLSGFSNPRGLPPPMRPDETGTVRTRLLQVMVKEDGNWKTIAYHNVRISSPVSTAKPH